MTHEEVQALASEYVLQTTDEVTTARIHKHLVDCDACRAEMRDVAEVFDAVGRSVDPIDPPAGLRARVMTIPDTVPQALAATVVTTPPQGATVTSTASTLMPWIAAVAAGLVAAVAVWQAGSARAEVERLREQLADAQLMAGQAQVARAELQTQLDEFTHQGAVLRAADLVSFELKGQEGAHARAYVTHKDGMVFTADGLPMLPAGKTYQLWVIVNDKPVSVGVFAPDTTGRVNAVMDTPSIPAMPGAVAVTLEPEGGLPQPSSAPILVGLAQF